MLPESLQPLAEEYKEKIDTNPAAGEVKNILSFLGSFNYKKILLIFLAGLAVLLILAGGIKIFVDYLNKDKPVTLIYWGLEDEQVMKPVIEKYQKDHPKVKITYVKQSTVNYRSRLQTQLKSAQAPDIFRINSSWLPMFQGDVAVVPER
jgi:ABC-type glycerol-3-phosphate transport system substrate-binding protein